MAKEMSDQSRMQGEAYLPGLPCITLRENTEWVETLEGGWNVLVGADKRKIVEAIQCFYPSAKQKDIFGGAGASGKILNIMATI
ncbi:MAG: UDP-N-acetyl glucosamine 2-epimerase [Euryarchaeota archaeon]|nr:UDP-N-acetyl glucosamine 2-epimerase [Euryarchaeota archaeon]